MERQRGTRAEDAFETSESEFESVTIDDLVGRLDRDEDDPHVTPWKRNYNTSFRHLLAN